MVRKSTALLVVALLLAGCGEPSEKKPYLARYGLRIVSLAPNTAEILYALGLSNQVVGVSRFCTYPPDVTNKPSVGGTYDPNFEMIVALQPDLVVGLDSQKEIESQLKQLGIPFLGVAHEHIREILQSILTIGKACGAEPEAQRLFQTLELTASEHSIFPEHRKPKVLVCVGHDESLSRMYIAAKETFYDELIEYAGGVNACERSGGYPEISQEGLAIMNPEVIINILPNPGKTMPDFSKVWKTCRTVILTNDYASIPGPRFVLLLKDFIEAIHE